MSGPETKRTPSQLRTAAALLWEERGRFLAALAAHVPECLDERRTDPASDRAVLSLVTNRAVAAWQRGDSTTTDAHIRSWQNYWNLSDAWLFDVGRDTLAHWSANEDNIGPDDPLSFVPGGDPQTYEGRPFWNVTPISKHQRFPSRVGESFDILIADLARTEIDEDGYVDTEEVFGSFDPRTETKAEAKKRLMASLERRLEDVLDRCITDDNRFGAEARKPKREDRHFEWLVRFQVLRQTKNQIAYDADRDRKSVREGINTAAESIGLTLRK